MPLKYACIFVLKKSGLLKVNEIATHSLTNTDDGERFVLGPFNDVASKLLSHTTKTTIIFILNNARTVVHSQVSLTPKGAHEAS